MGSLLCCLKSIGEEPRPLLSSPDVRGVARFILHSQAQRYVVVLAGAGCSTSAGIPDFRSPGTGLYDNLQRYKLRRAEDVFSIDYFKRSPDAFYDLAKELWPGTQGYKPTLTHHFIALLEKKGRLLRCFTQNIDGLERLAGVPPERIVAAHGSFDSATCVTTGKAVPVEEVRDAVMACKEGWQSLRERHGGLVKPDIVFFGESLPPRFFSQREVDMPKCELLLVVGTSLAVQPFASLPDDVFNTCIRVLINRDAVGFACDRSADDAAWRCHDVALLGDCDAQVLSLARELGWEEELRAMRGFEK